MSRLLLFAMPISMGTNLLILLPRDVNILGTMDVMKNSPSCGIIFHEAVCGREGRVARSSQRPQG